MGGCTGVAAVVGVDDRSGILGIGPDWRSTLTTAASIAAPSMLSRSSAARIRCRLTPCAFPSTVGTASSRTWTPCTWASSTASARSSSPETRKNTSDALLRAWATRSRADPKVNALLFAVDAEPSESELHFGELADTFLLRVRDPVAGRIIPMHPQHRQSGLCLRCGRQCADQFPVVDMNTAPQRRAGDASCSRSEEIPGIDVKGASRPHAPLWHAADRGHSRSQSTALAVGRPLSEAKTRSEDDPLPGEETRKSAAVY